MFIRKYKLEGFIGNLQNKKSRINICKLHQCMFYPELQCISWPLHSIFSKFFLEYLICELKLFFVVLDIKLSQQDNNMEAQDNLFTFVLFMWDIIPCVPRTLLCYGLCINAIRGSMQEDCYIKLHAHLTIVYSLSHILRVCKLIHRFNFWEQILIFFPPMFVTFVTG